MNQTSSMQSEIKIPANWMKNGCKLGKTIAKISKPYPKTYNEHCKGQKTCSWPVEVCCYIFCLINLGSSSKSLFLRPSRISHPPPPRRSHLFLLCRSLHDSDKVYFKSLISPFYR
jgi:hypothetical protein